MWERGCESVRFGDGGRALKKKICFSGVVTVDVRVCGWQKRVGLLYLCVGVIFPPSCAKKKGRHCKLCKWVCVYLRDMWGYVCVGVRASACVCVCMCVCATRIHKLPVPELEGCPGASANPLLGDLGSYRFRSPAFVFFRLFINSRSKLAIAPVCFVLFPPAGYFADISTTILVTRCRKIIPFFCSSAECRKAIPTTMRVMIMMKSPRTKKYRGRIVGFFFLWAW